MKIPVKLIRADEQIEQLNLAKQDDEKFFRTTPLVQILVCFFNLVKSFGISACTFIFSNC